MGYVPPAPNLPVHRITIPRQSQSIAVSHKPLLPSNPLLQVQIPLITHTNNTQAAKTAFPSWAATPPNIKRNIFLKAADILESRTEEVGKWEEEEVGATTFYASGFDVPTAVNGLRDVAGRVSSLVGTVPALQDPSTSAMILKEPYGVIVGIAPW